MKKAIRTFLSLLFSCMLAIGLYQLYSVWKEYEAGDALYANTAKQFTHSDVSVQNSGEEPEPEMESLTVDFDALLHENPDVVAWIYCAGTEINYPVLQGRDNDQYLRRMLDGTYNVAGSIFLDARCASDFSTITSIIYGHNMKNESMFGSLPKYEEQVYYDEHPNIWLFTPEKNYCIEVVSGFITPADSTIYTLHSSVDAMRQTLADAAAHSDFVSAANLDNAERMVVLSTCAYDYEDARYVLTGVLRECVQ